MIRRLIALLLVQSIAFASFAPEAAAQAERLAAPSAPLSPAALPTVTAITPLNAPAGVPGVPGAVTGLETTLPSIPALPQIPAGIATPEAGRYGSLPLAAATAQAADASKAQTPAASAETAQPAAQAEKAEGAQAAVSAIESSASRIEAAPATRVASQSRISKVIRSVRSIFGAKQDTVNAPAAPLVPIDPANGPSSTTPQSHLNASSSQAPPSQTGNGSNVPPAPPSSGGNDNGGNDDGGKSWFGLGKTAVSFIGALVVAQIGVEALGAAMPTLVQKAFGDFTVVAQLAIFSSIASITGRQMAPIFVQKYGLKKVYLAAEIARVFSIGALVGLLITAHMTLPLMMGFYCLNGFLGGVAVTAESSIPPAIVGQDQKKIERFWTWEQTLLETIGVSGPIVTGMVVKSMGFVPALVAYPVALAAAIVILFFTLRIPAKVEAMRLADLQKAKESGVQKTMGSVFKEFFQKVARGAKLVWNDKILRTAFLGYTAYMALNPFLYSMLAPAYALRLTHNNPEVATSIGGWLTGLYSAGGLLAGFIMLWEQKKLDKAKEAGTLSSEKEDEVMRASMLKWMKWGTVGLAAMLTLTFASPIFLGGVTLPALALIPFGIAQVIATVKMKSYFQAKAPQEKMADAMGFFGSASLAVSTSGLLALKYIFKALPGFTPFWWIAAAMIPLGAYYVYLTRQMAKVSKPDTGDKK